MDAAIFEESAEVPDGHTLAAVPGGPTNTGALRSPAQSQEQVPLHCSGNNVSVATEQRQLRDQVPQPRTKQ